MRGLADDVHFAVRSFAKTPAFTVTSVLTLALGIGAVSVVFALASAFLLRPLPVDRPHELVSVSLQRASGSTAATFHHPQFALLQERAGGVATLAAFSFGDFGVAVDGEPEATYGMDVSGGYFATLGLRPALGRFFAAEEDAAPGAHPVVVVSHDFWQTRLGATPDAVGRTIRVNGHPLTVIGVAPQGFTGTITPIASRIWVPIAMYPVLRPDSDIYTPGRQYWLHVFGRLAPATTRAQAERRLTDVVAALDEETRATRFDPGGTSRTPVAAVRLAPLRGVPAEARGALVGFMTLLMVTAGLVLAIACVNVASMLLARGTTRGREIGVRLSLGASRMRIVRQLLTESTLLFLLGAGAGVLLASWAAAIVAAIEVPAPVPVVIAVGVDGGVIGFALAVALLCGTAFGLAPALHGTRSGIGAGMKEGAGARRGTRLRSAFVAGQVALSMVLLIAAGLLVRALQSALAADPGMDTREVVIAQIDLAPHGYDDDAARAFHDRVRERLVARPGVEGTALSAMVNLTGSEFRIGLRPADQEPIEGGVLFNAIDPNYLGLLRVPILTGRGFTDADRAGAQPVALVNQAFAERYWPGASPIGQRLVGRDGPIEVVGVTATSRYLSPTEAPRPLVYLPYAQNPYPGMYLYVRGASPAHALLAAAREEVAAIDRDVPLRRGMTLEAAAAGTLFPQRFAASMIGVFGMLGLVLAAVGIYGLVAFSVGQRRREIGVRVALGAGARDVVALVGRQGARLVVIGGVAGLILAAAATRLLSALLHGVSPTDPLTYTAVPLLLVGVGAIAAYLPARRAGAVDPMQVLRQE